jgi:plasmid stabilization system protein ParE
VIDVAFLPSAESDYIGALAWYMERSERAAVGFEAAVNAALRSIAVAPTRWPFCDGRHRLYVLRRYPYSVIYRVESDGVLVVAVAHAKRSADFWRDRG